MAALHQRAGAELPTYSIDGHDNVALDAMLRKDDAESGHADSGDCDRQQNVQRCLRAAQPICSATTIKTNPLTMTSKESDSFRT